MVFDVAGSLDLVGLERTALKFMEHSRERLAHHIGQHVQAPTVGHAQDDVLNTQLAAAFDDLLERRDQRFAAVQTKALGALVFDVEKLLEPFGLDQLVHDRQLAVLGEFDALVWAFDALLNPGFFRRVGDVHEFHTKGGTIGAFEDFQHLRDGRKIHTQHFVEEDRTIVIFRCESIGRRMQFVVVFFVAGNAQWIQIGMEMTAHAVGTHHHNGADGIPGGLLNIDCRRLAVSTRRRCLFDAGLDLGV